MPASDATRWQGSEDGVVEMRAERSAEASCCCKLAVMEGCSAQPGCDAGSSKGGCVIDFAEPWIMIPSDFLHCLLFPKFMGHLGTCSHVAHLLTCVGVCRLYSTVKPHEWRTVCAFSPSETWADFNDVCQHSLAIRHLQYTHEKEFDFLELSRGDLWWSSRTLIW